MEPIIYSDFLLKFPSKEAAIMVGVSHGTTDEETETTATYAPPFNVCLIGTHRWNAGTEEVPDLRESDWWVLIRVPADFPAMDVLGSLPDSIRPELIERNPEDPTIPNIQWA